MHLSTNQQSESTAALGAERESDAVATRQELPLRVLIADDEQICREALRRLLRADAAVEIIAVAEGGAEAIAAANQLHPDLLFLDVEMPGTDGFAVVRALRLPIPPAVVFVTGNERGAIQAFEVAATDYLLKPCRLDRLKVALQRARTHLERARREALSVSAMQPPLATKSNVLSHLSVKAGQAPLNLEFEDVCWIETDVDRLLVHAAGQDYGMPETLERLHASLPPQRFFLASPNLLVNLNQVSEVRTDGDESPQAVFRDGSRRAIPVQSLHLLPPLAARR